MVGVLMAVPANYAQGIDISHWDGQYDPGVRPVDFVIAKASEGSSWRDVRFGTPAQTLLPATIWGAYHYYRSGIAWRAQADNLLAAVAAGEQRMGRAVQLLALDYETINNQLSAATDADARRMLDYLLMVQSRRVLLYAQWSMLAQTMPGRGSGWVSSGEYPVWVARWFERGYYERTGIGPGLPHWHIWQYGGDYRHPTQHWEVPGYNEGRAYGVSKQHIDLDTYNGTLAEMRAWLGITEPAPPTPPPDEPTPPREADQCTTGGGLNRVQRMLRRAGLPYPV